VTASVGRSFPRPFLSHPRTYALTQSRQFRNFHPSGLVLREQLPLATSPVQFSVIAVNVLYAVIGVVLMFVSYRAIDRLTPQVDFPAELQRGNVAVAIFVAAIFVSIALIIGKALG
jgi:uncharacterized membrane protein YjfL (UPF0719 family)